MKLGILDDPRHAAVSLAGTIRNPRKMVVISLVICCAGFTFHARSTLIDKARNR